MPKPRFKDITDLGEARVEELDQMLLAGAGPKRIRTMIKTEWGLLADKSDAAVEKLVNRYKHQVVEGRLLRELDKAGMADVRKFSKVYNPLNVAHEMAMALAETGYHAKGLIDDLMKKGSPIIPAQHTLAVERAFKANHEYVTLLDKIGLRPKMQMSYRDAVAPSEDSKVAKIEVTPAVAAAAKRIRESLGVLHGAGVTDEIEPAKEAAEA